MSEQQFEVASGERRLPLDLSAVVVLTIALNAAVFASGLQTTPLRVLLGFVFVCFAPGYAVVAAVYPERSRETAVEETPTERTSIWSVPPRTTISGGERFLLAVAFSIIIVPAIGYAFNFTAGGVRLVPVLLALSGFTVGTAAIAAVRRYRLPAGDRFCLRRPNRPTPNRVTRRVQNNRRTFALNAALVIAVLLFAGSIGYTVVEQSGGAGYSEIYLTSGDGSGDGFVGENVSERVEPGAPQELGVAVGNHEGRPVEYSVVVVQQTVEGTGEEMTVSEQTRLDRFEMQVEADETRVRESTFTPSAGENTRIVWLLYLGAVPEQPSTENTEYHVHLWVGGGDSEQRTTPARLQTTSSVRGEGSTAYSRPISATNTGE